MATLERPVDRGTRLGRAGLARIGQEIRDARRDRGLSIRALAAAAGISPAELSRIERGLSPRVPFITLSRLAGAGGLDLVGRTYPGPQPIRDAPQLALLGEFRSGLHRSVRWAAEVLVPVRGDQRAWDAVISGRRLVPTSSARSQTGDAWRYGVEAETRPMDAQALHRRIQAKLRDSNLDGVLIVLPNSRHARLFMAAAMPILGDAYPVPGRRALELLRAGLDPGGSSIILMEKPRTK